MSYHVWYWDILGMYKDFDSGIERDVVKLQINDYLAIIILL